MGKSLSAALLVACSVAASGCGSTNSTEGSFNTAQDLFSVQRDDIITRREATFSDVRDGNQRHLNSIRSVIELYRTRALIAYEYEQRVILDSELVGAREESEGDLAARTQIQREAGDLTLDPQDHLDALIAYRNAGWDASDAICQYTLDVLGESQAAFQNTDRIVNLGSGFLATVLGIAGASAEALSYFTASDALYDSWAQNYEEYAFVAPSPRELARLVRSAQVTYRDEMGATANNPASWNAATVQIQSYNRFCLATGMRSLVDEAVRGAEVRWDRIDGVAVIGSRAVEGALLSSSLGAVVQITDQLSEVQTELASVSDQLARVDAEKRLREAQRDALPADDSADANDETRAARSRLTAQIATLAERSEALGIEVGRLNARINTLQTQLQTAAQALPSRAKPEEAADTQPPTPREEPTSEDKPT